MSLERIVLVPLDERPVNTRLATDIGAIAGAEVILPPPEFLPHFRRPADLDGLSTWLVEEADHRSTTAIVVCIDTLVFGGLISARTSTDSTVSSITRLDVLRQISREHPTIPMTALSLITRATDSYSNVEEPDYWNLYGREIHRFGGEVHRSWADGEKSTPPEPDFPHEIREDFAWRRLRNHQVTLAALGMHWEGVIDTLAITADDTAESSAGSAEQFVLQYWRTIRPSAHLEVYPGADETGAVLVAHALARRSDQPVKIRVVANIESGMDRIPPYENQSLRASIPRQVRQAGAEMTTSAADAVLVVHTPDPERGDLFADRVPESDHEAVLATVEAVKAALESGADVAVADLRFGNGADAMLVEELAAQQLLWHLCGFAGWNTAGNSLGTAVASTVATVVGKRAGTHDETASKRALARRILDDYAWQGLHRARLSADLFQRQIEPIAEIEAAQAELRIAEQLKATLLELDPEGALRIDWVRLPWNRSFEIDVLFDGE